MRCWRESKHLKRSLLLVVLLTGCEILDIGEEPVEVVCRAECEECKNVVLECDGTGKATVTQQKKVTK